MDEMCDNHLELVAVVNFQLILKKFLIKAVLKLIAKN
jgi:hypothetical protein